MSVLPFVSIFKPYFVEQSNQDYSIVTYDVEKYDTSIITSEAMLESIEEGYINVRIGQDTISYFTRWSKVTLISILLNLFIEAFTLLGLVQAIMGGYQAFAYHAEAMNTLYHERLD
mmetsp:Transcript_32004/g.42409  ORF Transcript_32004/g.42409 Transcript_32004/m.42409 type:complete len:116 (-) Transcript_32004:714-1061(-)